MGEAIQVLRTYCPFWERTVYELWDGFRPLIPANNYLRSNLMLSDTTIADKAYSLVAFFRFLRRNSVDFFELSEHTLRPLILQFRNELLFRVRQSKETSEQVNLSRANKSIRSLSYLRARSVLSETGWLCEWWGLVKTRTSHSLGYWKLGSPRGQWNESLPDSFNIGIPRAQRKFRENHVIEPYEVEAIWEYLTSGARPEKPGVLAANSFGPKRGWSAVRAAAWKHAQQQYRERLAWFHRQQMLWALLIGSGLRRGEVPLIMSDDVRFHGDDLWISLRLRKITEDLGHAKTGPRTVFVGWDPRIVTAWQNWTRSRQVMIDKWTRTREGPKHEMFLTNRNGGPLTADGLDSLFETLNKRFHIFGGEFPEDQFKLHPHAIRHTVESLFEDWGVPLDVRQRHLGHKRPETTELYGKTYRKTYIAFLQKLEPLHQRILGGICDG